MDLLSYCGNVALLQENDAVHIHQAVYSQNLPRHLLGTDMGGAQARILQRRASDPYYSATYLPYFSVKPLYIFVLSEVHKLGFSLATTVRIVSAVCYLGIAVVLWWWSRSLLALGIMVLPEVMALGRGNEPDGLSTLLLLLAFWLLFIKKQDWGVLAVLVSLWVRPDNLILALAVIAMIFFTQRVNWVQAIIFSLLAVGSVLVIDHYSYGWKALYYHTFLGGQPDATAQFGFNDYRNALSKGFHQIFKSHAPVYIIVWLVSFARSSSTELRKILFLVAFFSATRFLIFPSFEPRFYSLFFVCTAVAAILEAKQSLNRFLSLSSPSTFPGGHRVTDRLLAARVYFVSE